MAINLDPLRGQIIHDTFTFAGGGERVAMELAKGLMADLFTARLDRNNFPEEYFSQITPLEVGVRSEFLERFSQTLELWLQFCLWPRSQRRWTIFSGAMSPLAQSRIQGKKIMYCHTPPRMLYDLKEYYLSQLPRHRRVAFKALCHFYEKAYAAAIRSMDLVIANSATVQRRIDQYLGRPSTVVYPPCDIRAFTWERQEGYYLSTARLEPLKRVEMVVNAFRSMPEKKLKIVSSGSMSESIKRLASTTENIEFIGLVSDKELQSLMGGCIATLYIPKDEDFGMSPVESMAAGKAVIGVAEGGVMETVVHGETGLLIPENPSAEDVVEAVRFLTPEVAAAMRQRCEERAAQFGLERFKKEMRSLVDDVAG